MSRIATILLFLALGAGPIGQAAAQTAGTPRAVFGCSLGTKGVSVKAVGTELIYSFGRPGRVEMSIIASAARRNVFYREDRYAGLEHQLRFVNGQYSYIVYNMEGNGRTGASPIAGLVVMGGRKVVARMRCTRYAEFGPAFDLRSLPEDSEAFSAM